KNFVQAEDAFKHALQLDPKNVPALHAYAHILSGTGRLKEALALRRQIVTLDPLDASLRGSFSHVLALNGQYSSAMALKHPTLVVIASTDAAAGHFKEAADTLLKSPPGSYAPGMAETAARLLRTAPAQVASPQELPAFAPGLNFVYL